MPPGPTYGAYFPYMMPMPFPYPYGPYSAPFPLHGPFEGQMHGPIPGLMHGAVPGQMYGHMPGSIHGSMPGIINGHQMTPHPMDYQPPFMQPS